MRKPETATPERDLPALLERLADAALDELESAPEGEGSVALPAGVVFGSASADVDLPVDRALRRRIRREVVRHGRGIRRLVMEGAAHDGAAERIDPVGAIDLFVDPLDGSLNYLARRRSLGLPYSLVVTAMPAAPAVRVGDARAGLVVDLRSGDRYLALRRGAHIVSTLGGAPARVDGSATSFDGRHIYFFDTFHPATRELLGRVARADDGWFRNAGGAGYEMVCVGSGLAALFCSSHQKMHELGAAWLFNTGAGGVAKTLDGRPLADVPFEFDATIDVVFSATEALWRDFQQRLAGA